MGYDPDAFIEGGIEEVTGRVWIDVDIPDLRESPRGMRPPSWDVLDNLDDVLRSLLKP